MFSSVLGLSMFGPRPARVIPCCRISQSRSDVIFVKSNFVENLGAVILVNDHVLGNESATRGDGNLVL